MSDDKLAQSNSIEEIKVVKIWKLEIRYSKDENCYMGTWKWGRGENLVGSFTYIKKK